MIAWTPAEGSLDFVTLRALYRKQPAAVGDVVDAVYARIAADAPPIDRTRAPVLAGGVEESRRRYRAYFLMNCAVNCAE